MLFINDEPALELELHWRARSGHGPVEHWQRSRNNSDKPVVLHHQDSLDLHLTCPKETEAWWIGKGGSNASATGGVFHQPLGSGLDKILFSGPSDYAGAFVPWVALQVGEAHGLYVGWEFSGKGRVHLQGSDNSPNSARIRVGLHPRFKTTLQPGSVFETPLAFIGCYCGDLDEGSYRLGQFIYDKIRPSLARADITPILNCCELWLRSDAFQMTEESVRNAIKWAVELGFEICLVDAGWFERGNAGDWYGDSNRFPSGMRSISDYAHSLGVDFGLWIAPTHATLSERSDAFSARGPNAHPEWLTEDCPPDWKSSGYSGRLGCLACPELVEWVNHTLLRFLY